MRRLLGPVLLATLLATGPAGCGTDEVATDGSPTPTGPGRDQGTGRVEQTRVELVSRSAAGGEVDGHPTVLDDAPAVRRFAAQFRTDAMRDGVRAAAARIDVPDGETLVGAVVMLGCDVPPGVRLHGEGDSLEIVPLEPATTHPECLVAVTTVALVSVDSAQLAG